MNLLHILSKLMAISVQSVLFNFFVKYVIIQNVQGGNFLCNKTCYTIDLSCQTYPHQCTRVDIYCWFLSLFLQSNSAYIIYKYSCNQIIEFCSVSRKKKRTQNERDIGWFDIKKFCYKKQLLRVIQNNRINTLYLPK